MEEEILNGFRIRFRGYKALAVLSRASFESSLYQDIAGGES